MRNLTPFSNLHGKPSLKFYRVCLIIISRYLSVQRNCHDSTASDIAANIKHNSGVTHAKGLVLVFSFFA